jgi:hypothetical protein
MGPEALDDRVLDARDLDLNVQESPIPETREDLLQHWKIRQIACSRARNLHSMDFRIMADHASPIPSLANIEFEAVAPVRECEIKRSKRIFRDGSGCARAAMAEQKGSGHRKPFNRIVLVARFPHQVPHLLRSVGIFLIS